MEICDNYHRIAHAKLSIAILISSKRTSSSIFGGSSHFSPVLIEFFASDVGNLGG